MAVLADEDFEIGTAGAAITSSNSAFSAGAGTPTFDSAQFFVNAQSALFNPVAGLEYVQLVSGTTLVNSSIRFYARISALPSVATYLATPLSTATIRAQLGINADGTVRIRGGAGGTTLIATTTAALSTATWYRFEWQLNGTASTQALRIFVGHGTSPISGADISGAFVGGTFDRWLFGVPVSGTLTWNADATKITDAAEFIGPVTTGPAVPTGLAVTPISSSELDLSWNAVSGVTGYDVERDGSIAASGVVTNAYADTGRSPATTYSYRVRSVV